MKQVELLTEKISDMHLTDKNGNNLLHIAVEHNHQEIIRLLILKRISLIHKNKFEQSLLEVVVEKNDLRCAEQVALAMNCIRVQSNAAYEESIVGFF